MGIDSILIVMACSVWHGHGHGDLTRVLSCSTMAPSWVMSWVISSAPIGEGCSNPEVGRGGDCRVSASFEALALGLGQGGENEWSRLYPGPCR